MTQRDDARRNWGRVAAGSLSDPDLQDWLRKVARALLDADELKGENTRPLSIVAATGLSGPKGKDAHNALHLTFVIRDLQVLAEREPEEFARTDHLTFIATRMGWIAPSDDEAEYRWRHARSRRGMSFPLSPEQHARATAWVPKGFAEPLPPSDPKERARFFAALPPLTPSERAEWEAEGERGISQEGLRKRIKRHMDEMPAEFRAELAPYLKTKRSP